MLVFLASAIALFTGCQQSKEPIVTSLEPVEYVDPFIGTDYHGHTYPGATTPYGAVQLSPDTRRKDWDGCSGYHYSDSTLMGFSHTHLSGTGCMDLADVLFRPTTREINLSVDKLTYPPAAFSHSDEKAEPGYYRVNLADEQILAELTATTYAGMHRYTYPKGKPSRLIIDLAHSLDDEIIYETSLEQTAGNEITGMRCTRGWVDNQQVYFVAQFSKPFQKVSVLNAQTADRMPGKGAQALLEFDTADGKPVVAKVGLSIVSTTNAKENLLHDVPDFDFDKIQLSAKQNWNAELSAFQVESDHPDDLKTFYTALYHTLVVPNLTSDVNGSYRRNNQQIGRLGAREKRYSTLSIWDTFRAWHPLITLTDTTLVRNLVNTFLDMYDATGELPIWPLSSGETRTMIGYHTASVIADAYVKGIRGFDAEKALEALIVSSEKNAKGADYYVRYGYIPSDLKSESVSCLLEYAYDDWCIAQLARELGKTDVYERFIRQSQNFNNVFDGQTRFFRSKRSDGHWDTPFNPFAIDHALTEATAWQYRYFVPHDVFGLAELFGGTDPFTQALDSLFTVTSEIEGHQSDVTGLIGQYAHGNEPSHHIAYLYNYLGQPWKTQEMTRRLLKEMYQATPAGLSGNEDCGQMSAWYVLSSLGLYQVCPGTNQFNLTTPLFPKATIRLANGKQLTISANDPDQNLYIESVELNNEPILANYLTYEQLMKGGELRFRLAKMPNKQRGTDSEARPYSYTKHPVASVPYAQTREKVAHGVKVTLNCATKGVQLYFTTDGTEPSTTSTLYQDPVVLPAGTQLKVRAFAANYRPSRTFETRLNR